MAELLRTARPSRPARALLPLDQQLTPQDITVSSRRRSLPSPISSPSWPPGPTWSTSTAVAAAGSWRSRAGSGGPARRRRGGAELDRARDAPRPGGRARFPNPHRGRRGGDHHPPGRVRPRLLPARAARAPGPGGRARGGLAGPCPGGRLLVLGWCLPSNCDDLATLHGQLITGVALDEALHGGRLRTGRSTPSCSRRPASRHRGDRPAVGRDPPGRPEARLSVVRARRRSFLSSTNGSRNVGTCPACRTSACWARRRW